MPSSRRWVRRLGKLGIYFLWNWNAEQLAGLWSLYSNYSTKELAKERKIRQALKQASCCDGRVGLSWNEVFQSRSGHHIAPISGHCCQIARASLGCSRTYKSRIPTERDSEKSACPHPSLLTPTPASLYSKYFQTARFLIRCLLWAMKGELGLLLGALDLRRAALFSISGTKYPKCFQTSGDVASGQAAQP